jgi:hypothetical protein
VTAIGAGWGYNLSYAVLLLNGGLVADLYGRRQVFQAGVRYSGWPHSHARSRRVYWRDRELPRDRSACTT